MRRLISLVSIAVALVALGLVLYNATVVDRRPPEVVSIALSAPAGDERVAQTLTTIDIEFSEPVRTATVESRFRIEPAVAGSFAWDGATAVFTPSARLPQDTEFAVRIEPGFEDLLGNVSAVGLEPWAFRTVGPPIVIRSEPGDGATGVPLDGSLEIQFDRLMDTASVEAALALEPAGTLRATWSGETVRVEFVDGLDFGTTYRLVVGPEAADTGGNHLAAAVSLEFTTVARGLSVIDAIPAAGVAGAGVRTPIAIRFDGPIDPETARAALRITPSVGGDVRVVSVPDDLVPPDTAAAGAPDTILFVPDDELAPHTTYTVTLAPTVASVSDPAVVAAGREWSFTTGSPSESGQNQVAFLSPRSGAWNVWLMNPDGTSPRQLTTELVPVSGFDATDDGSLVAYAAGGVVSVVEIDGDPARRLTPEGAFEYGPVVTPDDRWLIVARRGSAGEDLGFWLVPLPGTDGEPRQILAEGAPPIGSAAGDGGSLGSGDGLPTWAPRAAVDPTGRWILLVTVAGRPVLVDLDAPDGELPHTLDLVTDAGAAWSSRYRSFVVTAAPPGSAGSARPALWQVTTTSEIRIVAGTDGAVGSPAVGDDGGVAVTIREAAGRAAGIATLGPGAALPTFHAPARGFDDRWPAYAPDGRSVLVGRVPVTRPEDPDGIWLLDLATGVARQLSVDGVRARWLAG